MRSLAVVSVCLMLPLLVAPMAASAIHVPAGSQAPTPMLGNTLIVKFKTDGLKVGRDARGNPVTGLPDLDRLHAKYQVKVQKPLLKRAAIRTAANPLRQVYLLEMPAGTNMEAAAREYAKLPNVAYAHPDGQVELYTKNIPGGIIQPPPPKAPTDPLFNHQWALNNRGQQYYHVERYPGSNNDVLTTTSGTFDADIDYPEVYRNPPDRVHPVVVAIIDTGVDWDHPDLVGKMWNNPNEIPDNDIDDDHNGYVDDVVGWDYSGNEDLLPIWEDNDPTDTHGHGTHCAGIVAAVMDNIGVAGMVPDAEIMALKFYPVMNFSFAARALVYAADNGADVVNMSWGTSWEIPVVEDALQYARDLGVVLIAAAGNDGAEIINYPASYPQTVAVAATNSDDQVTTFSTFNEFVDVAAPGLSILSLRAEGTDMYGMNGEPDVHIIDEWYYLASGTSMAAPHVVGVAAYIRSAMPGLNPDAVQSIIEATAEDFVDPYGNGGYYPGWDMYSGHGRINLRYALNQVSDVRAVLTSPASFEVLGGIVDIIGSADGADFTDYVLEYGGGTNPGAWYPIASSSTPVADGVLGSWDTTQKEGLYTIRLTVNGQNVAFKRIFIANQPIAHISWPEDGETVSGVVPIIATGVCQDFSHIFVAYQEGHAGDWYEIVTSTMPAYHAEVTAWNAFELPEGSYALKVEVHSGSGLEASDVIGVNVERIGEPWSVELGAKAARTVNYGDFDGDGNNELIIGTENGLFAYNTDGSPKTTGMPVLPAGDFRIPVAVGTLDGDGIDDFVALCGTGDIYGFPSSDPAFVIATGMPAQMMYYLGHDNHLPKVFLYDVDGDGLDEINYYPGGAGRSHYLYRPDGTAWGGNFPLSTAYRQVQPADLDGDGTAEFYSYTPVVTQFDMYGNVVATLPLQHNGATFVGTSISAVDIDDDGKVELIVQGGFDFADAEDTHWLYAIDEGLVVMDGWPHDLSINTFLVPTHAVFGDLDDDGELEYVTTHYDLQYGHCHAWNLDGTPLLDGGPESGLFATTLNPAIMWAPVLADADGNQETDILAAAGTDLWMTFETERIQGWTPNADFVPGYPLPIATGVNLYSHRQQVPIYGDIDQDGFLDVAYASATEKLVFIRFPGTVWYPEYAPSPMWRSNRRLNFTQTFAGGKSGGRAAAKPAADAGTARFHLGNNSPNPFNPSTEISFSLPRATTGRLEVFDIAGRKVATLVSGELAAGVHRVSWNGTNDAGRAVASGVYFYRLQADKRIATGRMTLMK